jgi:Mg-chelatase subunit ChlD
MSLLAPLYVAGLLAISLPILFHLIRRTPQGRQTFSSLMFLSPSPPRVTRRSRLNNIFLLILRGIALSLLAFAFARPLLRQDADLSVNELQGRRIALLLDTSASMQRADLWRQAIARVEDVLRDASPADEIALFTFDRQVQDRLTFSEWRSLEPSRRAAVLRARLAEISPTWAPTNLGDALSAAADALSDSSETAQSSATTARQLVLISDLQQGSRLESLQGYQWPEGVLLEVKPVAVRRSANAGLTLVKDAADSEEELAQDGRLRIRVSNQAESTSEQFSLAWSSDPGPLKDVEPTKAYVPPGTSRVLRLQWPARELSADRLVLTGDDHDFDNTLYLIPPRQEHVRLLYVGDDAADDVQGLRYFLESAAPSSALRAVEFITRRSQEAIQAADLLDTRLAVVTANVSDAQAAPLRHYLEQGGVVFSVMKEVAAAEGVARLMNLETLPAEEAPVGDYALLGQIDFEHPLFAPFSDPRFADFTKIRFWKHRRVRLPEDKPAHMLARFDQGDPFLFEQTVGKGRLLVATSGWHPADSQLALSTKFVPLVGGLLHRPQAGYEVAQHTVYEPIELPPAAESGPRQMLGPDGRRLELPETAATFAATDRPGIYRLAFAGRELPLAVNLDADESRTAPFAVEELESRGARLGTQPTQKELAQRQRQLRLIELENRQKLWRWLIVGVLGVLVLETALAGSLAHRTLMQQVT